MKNLVNTQWMTIPDGGISPYMLTAPENTNESSNRASHWNEGSAAILADTLSDGLDAWENEGGAN